jgi:hypothetical protein
LLFNRRYRAPALVVAVLLVLGCAIIFPRNVFFQLRLKQMFTQGGNVNDELRYSVWDSSIAMWKQNPWWGVGPGHFNARFRAFRPEGLQLNPEYAHNDYLNTLADYGVVGTALVVAAWALFGLGVYKTWSSVRLSSGELGGKSGSNKFAFVFGASIGLLALLLHSVVEFNLHIPANAILAISLMALVSGHLRFATESFWYRIPIALKAGASAVLLLACGYLVSQAWRQATEFAALSRAARAPNFSAAKIHLLTRAFAIEPANPQTAYEIGECFRRQSQEGGQHYEGQAGVDYRQLAEQAMDWFRRGMALNRWDSRSWAGYGWCLDWLDQPSESYFWRAEELDPNNYYNLNNIGLHYVQIQAYAAARPWFERSLRLQPMDNPIAATYASLCLARLEQAATNDIAARLNQRLR